VVGTAVAINQDGTLNSSSNPAHAGELVSVWAPGAGSAITPGCSPPMARLSLSQETPHLSRAAGSVLDRNDSLEVSTPRFAGEVFGLLQVTSGSRSPGLRNARFPVLGVSSRWALRSARRSGLRSSIELRFSRASSRRNLSYPETLESQ